MADCGLNYAIGGLRGRPPGKKGLGRRARGADTRAEVSALSWRIHWGPIRESALSPSVLIRPVADCGLNYAIGRTAIGGLRQVTATPRKCRRSACGRPVRKDWGAHASCGCTRLAEREDPRKARSWTRCAPGIHGDLGRWRYQAKRFPVGKMSFQPGENTSYVRCLLLLLWLLSTEQGCALGFTAGG